LTHTTAATSWGILGDATPTGWDSDTDLTYDAATGLLTITMDLGVGAIKFRANDDWPINLGDTEADQKMEYDGDNIMIAEAGNYSIALNLTTPFYTYQVTKN
jgi:hypothetical protein